MKLKLLVCSLTNETYINIADIQLKAHMLYPMANRGKVLTNGNKIDPNVNMRQQIFSA